MYKEGVQLALEDFGIEKNAFIGNALRTTGRFLKSKLPTKQGVKEFFVGSPREFFSQVRRGTAHKPGGLLHESFRAPGTFNKALFYGLPGYEMARTAFDDEGNKAERLGGQLGGNLLGLAAWKPFGLVGSIGAGILGDVAGSAVGRGVSKLTPQMQQKQPQQPSGNFASYVY